MKTETQSEKNQAITNYTQRTWHFGFCKATERGLLSSRPTYRYSGFAATNIDGFWHEIAQAPKTFKDAGCV